MLGTSKPLETNNRTQPIQLVVQPTELGHYGSAENHLAGPAPKMGGTLQDKEQTSCAEPVHVPSRTNWNSQLNSLPASWGPTTRLCLNSTSSLCDTTSETANKSPNNVHPNDV
jgi:hypothetical protein